MRIPFLLALIGLLASGATDLRSQGTGTTRALVGVGLAAYQAGDIGGGGVALAAAVAIDRAQTSRMALRSTLSAHMTLDVSDNAEVCPPGDVPCVTSVNPERLLTAGGQVTLKPFERFPARLLAGVALSFPGNADDIGPRAEPRPGARATHQLGLELPLGYSRRAPLLQLTRMGFSSRIYSLNWVYSLTLLFPL